MRPYRPRFGTIRTIWWDDASRDPGNKVDPFSTGKWTTFQPALTIRRRGGALTGRVIVVGHQRPDAERVRVVDPGGSAAADRAPGKSPRSRAERNQAYGSPVIDRTNLCLNLTGIVEVGDDDRPVSRRATTAIRGPEDPTRHP
jgi:hypothetical protein